jgi:hypothetical protein
MIMTQPAPAAAPMDVHGAPTARQFNPYSENGGTILAIAGADFAVIAGDTRQSEGYSIQTRYAPKVFRLYVSFFLRVDTNPQEREADDGWGLQDGPRGPRRERVRRGRKHVREEGQAKARGMSLILSPRPLHRNLTQIRVLAVV